MAYADQIPGKFKAGAGKLSGVEDKADALSEKLNPFSGAVDEIGRIPFYSTGARAYIKAGGKPVGVARSIRWKAAYNATPINTIDTPHPWDIDVGQMSVNAQLDKIMDPTQGPEAEGLFHVMQSAVHAPLIEIQVLDYLGTSLFFARGMFVEVDGNVTHGSLSTFSARFVGVAYQHYVAQAFKPYNSVAGALSSMVSGLQGIASTVTGGIL